MCGIAGWFDKHRDLREQKLIIDRMSESLGSRGPDDSGTMTKDHICLIHRRLAVIDVENGAQPMTKQRGADSYTIVYNGELYNTSELRAELISLGWSFSTKSDTEVVLTAYMHWGESCSEHLNGIFAFGIWDRSREKLFLSRDRIGVKPLFFYQYNEGLIFASEINTLLQNPLVKPVINEEGMTELLLIGPGRTLGQGVFKDIGELLPGEWASFDGKRLLRRRYYTLTAHEHNDSPENSIENVRSLITDSVERQLVSDVPLCCFLSGGLDSSIISYIASEKYRREGRGAINTYSVDYKDNRRYFRSSVFQPTPDSDFIGIMTDAIGSQHHNVTINNDLLFRSLKLAVDARDLPGMTDVDASLLLFCGVIKEDFTVALSGECADELFGGYPWYHNRDVLFEDTFPWSRSLAVRRSILKGGLLPRGEEYVRQKYLDTCVHTDKLPTDSPTDRRMREMFSLNFYWFMQTLLDRKDRMSMYNGLEVRVPFCDYRIVDYAYNLPWEIKAMNGREKGIVREAFRGLLPDSIIDRKKSPYPKTHDPMYFRLCADAVRNIIKDHSSPLYGILEPSGVEAIINDPEKISSPWYGQLMRAPQILAYIIQLDYWFRKNRVTIEM